MASAFQSIQHFTFSYSKRCILKSKLYTKFVKELYIWQTSTLLASNKVGVYILFIPFFAECKDKIRRQLHVLDNWITKGHLCRIHKSLPKSVIYKIHSHLIYVGKRNTCTDNTALLHGLFSRNTMSNSKSPAIEDLSK